ncbi:HAD-IA family hydrolase [Pseudahrensia aquimaris]|uniref:phosphoglycolate phosphatase n=1 Tax=Pseudahrensia aquimaris TaxID=744461 RepID=A0ABW3FPD5_9HYPH
MSAENSLPTAPDGGTIVFDLDGTLVDSIRDLLPALNYTIDTQGLAPIQAEEIGKVVGQGALKMIARAFDLQSKPLTPDLHKELLEVFLAQYGKHTAEHTVFFDGCLPLLDRLEADGWILAVCTNKYAHLAESLLKTLGERHRFKALTGGDTFDFKKPDGRHIAATAALAGGNPSATVMVGDSISDIAGAKDADIPVIAVDFGYTDIPVTDLDPDIVISHFDEFDAALTALVAQRFT